MDGGQNFPSMHRQAVRPGGLPGGVLGSRLLNHSHCLYVFIFYFFLCLREQQKITLSGIILIMGG